ncbi:MAG: aminotransferase class IV [Pseudomonadota bacterium]
MARALEHGWHDGAVKPLSEIRISPLDRGFLFGDGVYEVIPAYGGKPLGLEEHLRRMTLSLAAIDLPEPCSNDALRSIIEEVITANGGGDQSIYIQVSRSGDDGRDHKFPAANKPSLFLMTSPLSPPTRARYTEGFAAISLPDDRWQRCDIKSTSMLANVLARESATQSGALEALLERDGFLVEGAASAIGCVIDRRLCLPPESNAMLPSVTRHLTTSIAADIGVAVHIAPIAMDDVRTADELLLMSSTKEIAPLTSLDGAPIGTGSPGAIWDALFTAYQERKGTL